MLAEPPVLVVAEVVNKGNFTVRGCCSPGLCPGTGEGAVCPQNAGFQCVWSCWIWGTMPLPQQWVLFAKSGVFPGCGFSSTVRGPQQADRCFLRAVDMFFPQTGITLGNSSLRMLMPSLLSPNRSSTISAMT